VTDKKPTRPRATAGRKAVNEVATLEVTEKTTPAAMPGRAQQSTKAAEPAKAATPKATKATKATKAPRFAREPKAAGARRIAVSGSQSGLGLAIRRRLEAAGAEVIGIDLPAKGAEVEADLSTADGRAAAVKGVLARCGGVLQGAVANAGIDSSDARLTFEVNFLGATELLAGLRPALAKAGRAGAVATVSHAVMITPGASDAAAKALLAAQLGRAAFYAGRKPGAPYAASKLALARWIRQQAPSADWAGSGISLNGVCPGAIQTPMLEKDLADRMKGPMIRAMPKPLGGYAQPDDLTGIFEFLLAPEARFIVGQLIVADGGVESMWRGEDWPAPWDISMARFLFKLFGPR
jgi:NAD(P)-dependent dehydrogenase (short-subunit alcohol dehydrogenase family)